MLLTKDEVVSGDVFDVVTAEDVDEVVNGDVVSIT